MPNSFKITTDFGSTKVIPVKLDQEYETLEILSFSIFPNEIYLRDCSDYGVVCGRVFCNKGLGLPNARVSIFIPLQLEDELNPIISTLYPYKSFEDLNEDGYKYNLLPYTKSHSAHVPVGTFPDRIDALTNSSVVSIYDKYYKFTAKTNDAGDFMIFGVPVGQHNIFMQVDLSDIGEFSLTPQDLIRMGLATADQVNGSKFKFSENYSELPQIITINKPLQVSSFFGDKDICDYYITKVDFDLTTEANVELKPTALFLGSLISTDDKKRLKRNCRVPAKQGWLCDLKVGPGQIETVRQTLFLDNNQRPILEEYRLENDGKLIDDNGTWVVEVPMNLDYVYTDADGNRQISIDGSVGVPTKGKYRFKIKWQQSTALSEETKRAYFLVPNIKEYGWTNDIDPSFIANLPNPINFTLPKSIQNPITENVGPFFLELPTGITDYWRITGFENVKNVMIYVDGVQAPEYLQVLPFDQINGIITIEYTLEDGTQNGILLYKPITAEQFKLLASYAFSLSWTDYGTTEMIQEAISCEDRFYEFTYNKVYTVSQLLDRYSNRFFPQKTIQIKNITDSKCEGDKNPFPSNDGYFRYDIFFLLFSFLLSMIKYLSVPIVVLLHLLALLWPIFQVLIILVWGILSVVYRICQFLENLGLSLECREPFDLSDALENKFLNLKLPLLLNTEDGCTFCKCNINGIGLEESNLGDQLIQNANQLQQSNVSKLMGFSIREKYFPKRVSSGTVAPVWGLLSSGANGEPSTYGLGEPVDEFPGTTESFLEVYKTLLGGSYSNTNPEFNRLPVFRGNVGGTNYELFTNSLTIAEKINLFNTKAKYFDNVENTMGDYGSPLASNQSYNSTPPLSPGNTGWNQMRVQWQYDADENIGAYHFDNAIVLIFKDTSNFEVGDIITFQDPQLSTDPNAGNAYGEFLVPNSVSVTYANPDFTVGGSLTTNYTLKTKLTTPIQKINCFPSDIEYFQILHMVNYNDYLNLTPFPTNQNINGDVQYSLPYRFLRSNKSVYSYGNNNGCGNSLPTNGTFQNGASIVRTIQVNGNDGYSVCTNKTTIQFDALDMWESFSAETNMKVVILQRGVDPNSPDVNIEFDLRRYFGVSNSYNATPSNYLGQSSTELTNNCIIRGKFKMNIPVQAGGQTPNGLWDQKNKYGLSLPRHHEISNNSSNLDPYRSNVFFQSNVFTYVTEYTAFYTDMLSYYSALDRNIWDNQIYSIDSVANAMQWSKDIADPNSVFTPDENYEFYLTKVKWNAGFPTGVNLGNQAFGLNYFSQKISRNRYADSSCLVPCRGTYEGGLFAFADANDIPNSPCDAGSNGHFGCGNSRETLFNYGFCYSSYERTSSHQDVSGYYPGEYVEGASCFGLDLNVVTESFQKVYSDTTNNEPWSTCTSNCYECDGNNLQRESKLFSIQQNTQYFSPVYARMQNEAIANPSYSNPNINTFMSNKDNIVFRTDRLPSSTFLQGSGKPGQYQTNPNGFLLHQNNGFGIFKVLTGCTFEQVGGGVVDNVASIDVSFDNLPGGPDGPIAAVAQSTTDCGFAVDLNSYYSVDNGTGGQVPYIHNQGAANPSPWSRLDDNPRDYEWFSRGTGCYNLVSRPIRSLVPTSNGQGKTYSDIYSIVEWSQRAKLTLAACLDVFSHTFSNNWINGTLYAYAFQNTTFFDANNKPYRNYCKDTIFLNDLINNFFYRSSPWDGTNFVGKPSEKDYGNSRNLLYPTTLLDLGPKSQFIQELILSDGYDGYIVDKIPSTTFRDVTSILNLFILTRLVNSNVFSLLFPIPSENGNLEGSDDPSVGAFFSNTRWYNGQSFAFGLLPGLVDADYSQLISINSEFGILNYEPNQYSSNDVFFENTDITTLLGIPYSFPILGITFSGDNQLRDYISPRRTIWNQNSSVSSPLLGDFTNIPIKTQIVPFYQWRVFHEQASPDSVFGYQSNNFVTSFNSSYYGTNPNFPNGFFKKGYQTLDRLSSSSEYFVPDGDNSFYYKGYLINFEPNPDNPDALIPTVSVPANTRNIYTFGAPFHFYFGLIQGASAMDRFITKYIDTNQVYE